MEYLHEIPVKGAPGCYLAYGRSSYDGTTIVVKFGWPDKNGNHSRPGGEMDMTHLLQAVTEAMKLGYIDPRTALQALKDGMP